MRTIVLCFCLLLMPSLASAQLPEPIMDLMAEARDALDGLRYEPAAAMASTLLEAGAEGYPEVEIVALQLLAAALYPEEPSAQNEERARVYLRRLVRATPDAAIPREITWPGLDSLLAETRASTFVVYADPEPTHQLVGVEATFSVPVEATRPAIFTMTAHSLSGGFPVVLAGAGPVTQVRLDAQPFDLDGSPLAPGEYELVIEATDPGSSQTEKRRFEMTITAVPLRFVQTPTPPAETSFLPERATDRTWRNVAVGAGVGVATGLVASAFRADAPAGNVSLDKRAFLIGGTMSLATILGGWFDPGRPLPDNAAHNMRLEADHARALRRVSEENARIRAEYRATITIGRELH